MRLKDIASRLKERCVDDANCRLGFNCKRIAADCPSMRRASRAARSTPAHVLQSSGRGLVARRAGCRWLLAQTRRPFAAPRGDRGLSLSGEAESLVAARKTADALRKVIEPDAALRDGSTKPGNHVLTGSSLLAACPDAIGGVRGTFHVNGGYGRFEYLNWAEKFCPADGNGCRQVMTAQL